MYFIDTYLNQKCQFGMMPLTCSGPSLVNEGHEEGRKGDGVLAVLKMLRSTAK